MATIVPRPSRLTTWPTWQPIQWVGQVSQSSTQAVIHPSTNASFPCTHFREQKSRSNAFICDHFHECVTARGYFTCAWKRRSMSDFSMHMLPILVQHACTWPRTCEDNENAERRPSKFRDSTDAFLCAWKYIFSFTETPTECASGTHTWKASPTRPNVA